MPTKGLKTQSGYVLILTLVALMGVGGVVVAGFTQGVKKQSDLTRYRYNEQILAEAKQALLLYAYNYPAINQVGPGRLPCPDTDNDGLPGDNGVPLDIPTCQSIGRLPWRDQEMNFYDARDASGSRLWYAVSSQFYNLGGGGNINSGTTGDITLKDVTGDIMFDGSGTTGVAAVIIAPGRVTEGNGVSQDRSVANADAPFDLIPDTDPGIIDLNNYLDRFFAAGGNTDYVPGGTNGFIAGQVDDRAASSIRINDQVIVITNAEISVMTEKATLQAYRTAIRDYLTATGNIYPWLYNYDGVANVAGLSNLYPALDDFSDPTVGIGEQVTFLGNSGRIPSIFAEYFTETNSQPIQGKLDITLSVTYPALPTDAVAASASDDLFFNSAAVQTIAETTANVLTNVRFVDIADVVGDDGRLTATTTVAQTLTQVLYFWDEHGDADSDPWFLCPNGGDEISDCHRTAGGAPNPGGANDNDEKILRVFLDLDLNGVVNFDADYSTAPVTAAPPLPPATATRHARISATFNGADVIAVPPLTARYQIDRHYHDGGGETFVNEENGTLNLADLTMGDLTLGMRYYPVLPAWAFDDGWHNSVMMAYADDYMPGSITPPPCAAGGDCLQIDNLPGNNNDKISLLVIASDHGWNDEGVDGFGNDTGDVFNANNSNGDDIFHIGAIDDADPDRDDKILVVDEL